MTMFSGSNTPEHVGCQRLRVGSKKLTRQISLKCKVSSLKCCQLTVDFEP